MQFMNPTLLKWMMNKHLQRITLGTDRTEKMMQTWFMNPAARESVTVILRTRAENLLDHPSDTQQRGETPKTPEIIIIFE